MLRTACVVWCVPALGLVFSPGALRWICIKGLIYLDKGLLAADVVLTQQSKAWLICPKLASKVHGDLSSSGSTSSTQRTSLVVKKYWSIKKEGHNGSISFKSYTPGQLTVELFAKIRTVGHPVLYPKRGRRPCAFL
uniref:Secreted protein n=1 Tax=Plectus sambesii TaxID=2011161 RepID=A0A914WD82_9BILA